MLKVIKFITILTLIISYFVVTTPLLVLYSLWPQRTRKMLNKLVSLYSKLVLKILNVQIEANLSDKSYSHNLIVSNHLSYLDIMVLSSLVPSSFVTSVEMKHTPVLGQITRLAGCLFVERRNKSRIKGEIRDIEQALEAGLNVIVFPEATSTNGDQVIKFKRSLFQAALNVDSAVVPVTINYQTLNGQQLSRSNRDYVCWYGDMDFAPHLWNLCQQKSLTVSVKFAEGLQGHECSAGLRDDAFEIISSSYRPFV